MGPLIPKNIFVAARVLAGLNQRELASQVGVSRHAIMLAEKGQATMPVLNALVASLHLNGIGIRYPDGTSGFGVYFLHPSDELPFRILVAGRELAGLTQQELAFAARHNRRTIVRAEAGAGSPKTVMDILAALEKSGVRVLRPQESRGYGVAQITTFGPLDHQNY